jgi:asparagine synthase (glutamine-hydrolysing)
MCGIAGFVLGKTIAQVDAKQYLEQMSHTIAHRGPDGEGIFCEGSVHMAHRRLSIIDLSESGSQPMYSHNGDLVIVYNGEVYNYVELKKELKKQNISFKGSSDTEVMLEIIQSKGADSYQQFNGMFAFALYDKKKRNLHLVRDRFGIKPLYYTINQGGIYFASEIKALLCLPFVKRKTNITTLSTYLSWGLLDHTDETFYEEIKQVPPGHELVWNIDNHSHRLDCYYKLEEHITSLSYPKESDYVAQFRELFKNSVEMRLRSDVLVGSCLSGGLDSSSVVGAALKLWPDKNSHPFNTFTSRLHQKDLDEWEYASQFDSYPNILMNQVFPDGNEFWEQFQQLIYIQDGPFSSASIFAQWAVMRKAKQQNLKVLLDGQGGDETLCGYRKFYATYLDRLLKQSKWRDFMREMFFLIIKRNRLIFKPGKFWRYLPDQIKPKSRNPIHWLNSDMRPEKPKFGTAASVMERQMLDLKQFSLPSLLHYEDRNSMAFSIEARVPFLDYRLVEFLLSVPPEVKLKNGVTKSVLRKAVLDWVPQKIINRKSKLGFDVPETQWYYEGLTPLLKRKNTHDVRIVELGLMLPEEWQAMVSAVQERKSSYPIKEVFRFACAEMWLEKLDMS